MQTSYSLDQALAALLSQANYKIDKTIQNQFITYLQLLTKWNKAYNLTAIRDPEEMLVYHIVDSLTALPYLQGDRILDVGSGAGLPGIPLALMHKEKQFYLLDSNRKKAAFLLHVKQVMQLDNLHILHSRVEKLILADSFATIISRAFATIADFVTATQHLADQHTVWVAMKGHYPNAELAQLPAGFTITHIDPVSLPNLPEVQRHIVGIKLKSIS